MNKHMDLLDALDQFASGSTVAALNLEEEVLTGVEAAAEMVVALLDEPQICRFAVAEPGKPMIFHEVQ